MNEKLMQAVRRRLEAMPTEDLLRIWKENDRERYAEETFEAARLILAGRGIEVPPQDPWQGPIQVARTARSLDPASEAFWMGLLRPLLWVGIAIGSVRCLYAVVLVAEMVRTETPLSWPVIHSFSSLVEATQSILDFVLPVALLLGAAMSVRLRPAGRWVLLVWGWVEAASCAIDVLHHGASSAFTASDFLNWAAWTLYAAQANATHGGYAFLIVFFVTRPQIVQLFDAPVPGFDLSETEMASTNDRERH